MLPQCITFCVSGSRLCARLSGLKSFKCCGNGNIDKFIVLVEDFYDRAAVHIVLHKFRLCLCQKCTCNSLKICSHRMRCGALWYRGAAQQLVWCEHSQLIQCVRLLQWATNTLLTFRCKTNLKKYYKAMPQLYVKKCSKFFLLQKQCVRVKQLLNIDIVSFHLFIFLLYNCFVVILTVNLCGIFVEN